MMTFHIDPIAVSLGNIHLRWYGLMYLLGFGTGWLLGRYRTHRDGAFLSDRNLDDFLTCVMLGVILGGRLGYVLFYDLGTYVQNPSEILRIWNGGMSFHGGLVGVLLAMWYFSTSRKLPFLGVADFVAPLVPPGLFFGRIGNFINGELWGKVSDAPWAMIFPGAGPYPRHPSQLYEALLEGALLFAILWGYSAKVRQQGKIAGLFAFFYGTFRFIVEFVRVPDAQIGYLAFGWLTMGQVLCVPLIFIGLYLFFFRAHAGSPKHHWC